MNRLRLQLGDITQMEVEAIVNSTDRTLLNGGPVHQAVHRAAGPGLADECALLKQCPVGEARITKGYALPTKYIIHTVAPIWRDGASGEIEALASCYRACLKLAEIRGINTLAFPSLGSGLQPQIPLAQAAPVVVQTLLEWVETHALPEKVLFVCYDKPTFQIHQKALKERLP